MQGTQGRLTHAGAGLTLAVVTGPSLPRYGADAWIGGFTIHPPEYTASISAATGSVVAATERIYLLRPGATSFHSRDLPQGMGDAVCVAAEPRRPGSPSRFAVATMDALHIYDGNGVASVKFPEDHGEVEQILWAPDILRGKPTCVLYVRFADFILELVPDGSRFGDLVRLEGDVEGALTMASDHTGLAFARFDDDSWDLDVFFVARGKLEQWYRRSLEAPSFFCGAQLAVAGKSVAVSFDQAGVWLTRDVTEQPFTEVEELRGRLDPDEGGGGAAIAFEGAADDAALFGAVRDSVTTQHIVRVDAGGRALRIRGSGD